MSHLCEGLRLYVVVTNKFWLRTLAMVGYGNALCGKRRDLRKHQHNVLVWFYTDGRILYGQFRV